VTDQYRRALYAPLVNAAVPLYNSQTPAGIDSAMAVSRRALIIYRDRPLSYIAYNISGAALLSKNDIAGAIEQFSKMAKVTKGDTTLTNDHKDALMRVADLSASRAEGADASQKPTLAKEAVARYDDFLKEYPNDPKALSGRARALQLS